MTEQVLDCKNKKVSRFDSRGSIWCTLCIHFSLATQDGKCNCCFAMLPKHDTTTIQLKKFDRIVESCEPIISAYTKNPCGQSLECGWVIRLGIINHYVPVRYLAEYRQLNNLSGEDRYKQFLETVKSECAVLPRHIHAVK